MCVVFCPQNPLLTGPPFGNDDRVRPLRLLRRGVLRRQRPGFRSMLRELSCAFLLFAALTGLDFTWCQSPDRGLPCPDGIFFLHIDEKADCDVPCDTAAPKAWQVGASRSNFGDERYENAQMQVG